MYDRLLASERSNPLSKPVSTGKIVNYLTLEDQRVESATQLEKDLEQDTPMQNNQKLSNRALVKFVTKDYQSKRMSDQMLRAYSELNKPIERNNACDNYLGFLIGPCWICTLLFSGTAILGFLLKDWILSYIHDTDYFIEHVLYEENRCINQSSSEGSAFFGRYCLDSDSFQGGQLGGALQFINTIANQTQQCEELIKEACQKVSDITVYIFAYVFVALIVMVIFYCLGTFRKECTNLDFISSEKEGTCSALVNYCFLSKNTKQALVQHNIGLRENNLQAVRAKLFKPLIHELLSGAYKDIDPLPKVICQLICEFAGHDFSKGPRENAVLFNDEGGGDRFLSLQ